MAQRNEDELKWSKPRSPIATIEVDSESLPNPAFGYGDIVTNACSTYAKKNPSKTATIYVYDGVSVNFHRHTWSFFIGVVGDKNLLEALLKEFQKIKGVEVKHSDYIEAKLSYRRFHIQDGLCWHQEDPGIWVS